MPAANARRTALIVDTLTAAFEPLMEADPAAFRSKFRKMAADPFAFYRGSACLFYEDMDRLCDDRSPTSGPPASGSTATCMSRTSART